MVHVYKERSVVEVCDILLQAAAAGEGEFFPSLRRPTVVVVVPVPRQVKLV